MDAPDSAPAAALLSRLQAFCPMRCQELAFPGQTLALWTACDVDPLLEALTVASGEVWTLGASRSPTASSFASGQSLTLMIDDGSAYAITWPSVTWKTDAGDPPTLNTTGFTAIQLWKVSTVLYGARVGDA
jgi:hypothetical protein